MFIKTLEQEFLMVESSQECSAVLGKSWSFQHGMPWEVQYAMMSERMLQPFWETWQLLSIFCGAPVWYSASNNIYSETSVFGTLGNQKGSSFPDWNDTGVYWEVNKYQTQ